MTNKGDGRRYTDATLHLGESGGDAGGMAPTSSRKGKDNGEIQGSFASLKDDGEERTTTDADGEERTTTDADGEE